MNINRVPSAQQPIAGNLPVTQPWFRFFEALATASTNTVAETGGLVPTFIAAGETFTVPENRQALFAAPIQVDGELVVDGELIEVN